jgi:hypothetical protein
MFSEQKPKPIRLSGFYRKPLTICDVNITLRLTGQPIPIQILDDFQHQISSDSCQLLLKVWPQLVRVYPALIHGPGPML